MVTNVILYYNLMRPPSYIRSVIDRNVVMWRMTVRTPGNQAIPETEMFLEKKKKIIYTYLQL